MKKITYLLALALTLLISVPASAQFKWGVEGGLGIDKASIDEKVFESNNRNGWFIGPKAQITIPIVGLAVDGAVLYNQKYLELTDGTRDYDKTMPSVEIPINLKYNIGFSSIAGLYIATGPQFGWNLGSKTLTLDDNQSATLSDSNFSWNVGAGLNLASHLTIGFNYNFALGKTGEIKNVTNKDLDFKNNTWQFRVGYWF